MSSFKVKVIEYEHDKSTLPRNYLRINISGSDVNYILVNTIRRLAISSVPCYAFYPNDINIEKNTSIFNNDQMRLRLSNMPIVAPVHKLDLEVNDIIKIETDALSFDMESKKDYNQVELEKEARQSELINNLHMYIEAKNTGSVDMNVTTEDQFTKFYIDDKRIDNIYKRPILIIKLKPGEEFKCLAVASKHIHIKHNIYSPCSVVSYDEIKDDEFELYLESYGQIPEKDILIMVCNIFIEKLNKLKEKILIALNETTRDDVEISIENENHTMGNIISKIGQDHPKVEFWGYKIDNAFENIVVIRCKVAKDTTVTQVISDVTDKLSKLFNVIIKEINKI